jgi:hypothetical protein
MEWSLDRIVDTIRHNVKVRQGGVDTYFCENEVLVLTDSSCIMR